MSRIRLHSMEIQPETGLLKLDFGRRPGSTVSFRFRPALPISNNFYLEASLYFRLVSTLTFSSLNSARVLIFFPSSSVVHSHLFQHSFCFPLSSVIFIPHIHLSLSSTSTHLSALTVCSFLLSSDSSIGFLCL